jgi:hypothetical protein
VAEHSSKLPQEIADVAFRPVSIGHGDLHRRSVVCVTASVKETYSGITLAIRNYKLDSEDRGLLLSFAWSRNAAKGMIRWCLAVKRKYLSFDQWKINTSPDSVPGVEENRFDHLLTVCGRDHWNFQ